MMKTRAPQRVGGDRRGGPAQEVAIGAGGVGDGFEVGDDAEGVVPGTKPEGRLNAGDDKHGGVFGEEKERKADARVFRMVAGDQFRFGLGQVEGGPFATGEGGNVVEDEGDEVEGIVEDEPAMEAFALLEAHVVHVERAGDHDRRDDREAEGNFVGDHLTGFAHGAVDGPFIIGGPAREDDADDFDAEGSQEEEDARVEVLGESGEVARPREEEEGGEGRGEGEVRGEAEEEVVGAGGDEVFLEEEFDAVGEGLGPAVPAADAHGTVAGLHAAGDFAFGPDGEHGDEGDEGEDEEGGGGELDDDFLQPGGAEEG